VHMSMRALRCAWMREDGCVCVCIGQRNRETVGEGSEGFSKMNIVTHLCGPKG
jgi:hypothetical protein